MLSHECISAEDLDLFHRVDEPAESVELIRRYFLHVNKENGEGRRGLGRELPNP